MRPFTKGAPSPGADTEEAVIGADQGGGEGPRGQTMQGTRTPEARSGFMALPAPLLCTPVLSREKV